MFKKVLGNYKCICGKEFNNSQSFNGHKSHCKQHLLEKGYAKEHIAERSLSIKQNYAKGRITRINNKKLKQQQELEQWLSEKHTCEKCGKVMTKKFGSGRFCSRSCANSRIKSEQTKQKISKSVKNSHLNKRHPLKAVKYCKICGKKLYTIHSKSGVCRYCLYHSSEGKNCLHKVLSENIKGKSGGIRIGAGNSKHGWYKGIYCDSTYELAYLIYCLDNKIPIIRCPYTYKYSYKGEIHTYVPDFLVNGKEIIEIKGYWTELVDIKTKAVTDFPIKVLYRDDLEYIFDYIEKIYNKKVDFNLSDLFDR